jgi:hypothetical protein
MLAEYAAALPATPLEVELELEVVVVLEEAFSNPSLTFILLNI